MSTSKYKYNEYIEGVLSGDIIAGKKIIKACQRHKDDLKKAKRSNYPYYFDHEMAKKYIDFIKLMRLHKGKWAGKLWPVKPFQEWIIAMVQGWRRKEDKLRRFEEVFFTVGKKNAKTTTIAGLIVAQFYIEPEPSGQYVFAASTRKQAGLCYEMSKKLVADLCKDYPSVKDKTQLFANSIVHVEKFCKMFHVSSEAGGAEGLGSSVVVNDEWHVQKTSDLRDNLKSGQADSQDPLLYSITTAGSTIGGPCHKQYDVCAKILDGILTDEKIFIAIYELDNEDPEEWKDINNYYKSCPNLGESPRLDFVKGLINNAIERGGQAENDVKTKYGNIWVGSSSVWIADDIYMKCSRPDIEHLGDGFAGLDLAQEHDLAALTIYYPESKSYKTKYFMPRKKLTSLEDYFDYKPHVEADRILITGENKNDYDLIEGYILENWGPDRIYMMYFDPYTATKLSNNLDDAGLWVAKYAQTFGNMSPPIGVFESLVAEGQIYHDGNPVTRWEMSNVEIIQNGSGYKKISKKNKHKKVDGPVSLMMALACETNENPNPSGGSDFDMPDPEEMLKLQNEDFNNYSNG